MLQILKPLILAIAMTVCYHSSLVLIMIMIANIMFLLIIDVMEVPVWAKINVGPTFGLCLPLTI